MILGDLVRGLWDKAVYVADVLNPFNSTVRKPVPRLGDDLAPAFHTRSALDLSTKDIGNLVMPETVHNHASTSRGGKESQFIQSLHHMTESVGHMFHKDTPIPLTRGRPLSASSKSTSSKAAETKVTKPSPGKASTAAHDEKAVGRVSPRTKNTAEAEPESRKRGRLRSQSRSRAASSSAKEPAAKKAKTTSTKKNKIGRPRTSSPEHGKKRKASATKGKVSPRKLRSSHNVTPTETQGKGSRASRSRTSPSKTKTK